MNVHVKIIAYLYIAFGIVGLLFAGSILLAMLGGEAIARDPDAEAFIGTVGRFIGAIFALLSLPSLLGGAGLLAGFGWARMLVMVLGFLSLFNPPFGTALGVYTLWALLANENVKRSLAR